MSIDWYDREGRLISMEEASALLADYDYKMLARTEVGQYVVSTVWLGLDHRFMGDGPPIIFETMVFTASSMSEENQSKPTYLEGEFDEYGLPVLNPDRELMLELDMDRYCTEKEAFEGHERMVEKIRHS